MNPYVILRFNLVGVATLMATLATLSLGGCGAASRSSTPDFAEVASDAERQSAARALAMRAQEAEKAGKPLDAIALYQESARTFDGLPSVWNNLGVALLKQQRHLDAVEAFQQAASRSPMDPRPLENIAIAYHERGWEQKALEFFQRALDVDPNSKTALRGAARSARRLNLANERSLERVREGLMRETDPAWIEFFQREKFRVQNQIDNARQGDSIRQSAAPANAPQSAEILPETQAITPEPSTTQEPN
jgi:tetratricopeptide (TPR) repeat protein